MTPDASAGQPVLRVVAGDASPEEIAAVVAAVAAGATAAPEDHGGPPVPPTTSVWSAPGYAHRNLRASFRPGPHGWRTSFWPR